MKQAEKDFQAMTGIRAGEQLRGGTGNADQGSQIDFEKLLGARTGTLVVQAPDRAIGQDAPAHGPFRGDFHAGEITQYLVRGRARIEAVGGVPPVERAHPALGFEDGDAVAVAPVVAALLQGGLLGGGIGEQKNIGNVLAAGVR